jgi:hypothetical protein
MTDIFQAATTADAQFVHDEWDPRTRAHDIDGLLDLYLADAILESPLVPAVLDQPSGVLRGHDELRRFFVLGAAGRPNDLVRWYRTGQYMFNGHILSAKPAGGRGPLSRGWYFPYQCPAQLLAFVAPDTDTGWLFTLKEAQGLAQQHSERGIRQLYWRLKTASVGPKSPRHEAQMVDYLLATRAAELFPK